MKIKTFIGFMLVFVLFQSCMKESTIPCVKEALDGMKSGHSHGQILQYSFKGKPVYYVTYDGSFLIFNYTLYDANCNVLCDSYGFCQDSILNSLSDKVVIIENH